MEQNKTKKQKEFKKLTRQYFIEQKLGEIILVAVSILFLIFVPYMLGDNLGDNVSIFCGDGNSEGECGFVQTWIEGFFWSMLGGFAGLLIFWGLSAWVEWNWDEAKIRARKEMKKNAKQKKK